MPSFLLLLLAAAALCGHAAELPEGTSRIAIMSDTHMAGEMTLRGSGGSSGGAQPAHLPAAEQNHPPAGCFCSETHLFLSCVQARNTP